MSIEVGIVDSGVDARFAPHLRAAAGFVTSAGGAVERVAAGPDRVGHGSAVAALILEQAPDARLLCAQVFTGREAASAQAIAAGIRWCVGEGARIVNLSLGLREDRAVLREACAEAVAQGVLLVASSPARGGAVYPAGYAQVLAASGDARLGPGECSLIEPPRLFGACTAGPAQAPGGASFAAARISGLAAAALAARREATPAQLIEELAARAICRGRERRTLETQP